MKNTTFKNASGLPNSQQKTTARDMAVLAAAVYHHFPQYYAWFSIPEFEYKGQKITTHNGLLKEFAGADGLKTGYTAASGYNIVTSAKRHNQRVIAVTMGHEQLKQRDSKVYAMMDKGLAHSSDVIDVKQLKNEINRTQGSSSVQTPTKTASVQNYLPKSQKNTGNWVVQTGAFASYAKAEAEAETVKNKLAGKFAARGTNVEKFTKNGSSMYRAQVTGFGQADAQKACQALKAKGMNCLTMRQNNTAYAQK
jgi:D-alanyl-D-alanine carboxypeptidase